MFQLVSGAAPVGGDVTGPPAVRGAGPGDPQTGGPGGRQTLPAPAGGYEHVRGTDLDENAAHVI